MSGRVGAETAAKSSGVGQTPAAASLSDAPFARDASHRAQSALDLMRLEAEGDVSISAIAERVGIGLRSLQITFATQYGLTPREMLTRLRLQKARAALLAPPLGARVTAIALDAGFTHLSRFSQTYRQVYGERPIETLRRAQAGETQAGEALRAAE